MFNGGVVVRIHTLFNCNKMKKKLNTSYKKMLRDRTPKVVDMALRWCKAKECWLNHVYDHFINIYAEKEMRYEATRIVLGISGKYHNFDFNKTIDWEDLDDKDKEAWQSIADWVKWFQTELMAIEQTYNLYKDEYNRTELEMFIVDRHINVENDELAYKLVKFILDNLS